MTKKTTTKKPVTKNAKAKGKTPTKTKSKTPTKTKSKTPAKTKSKKPVAKAKGKTKGKGGAKVLVEKRTRVTAKASTASGPVGRGYLQWIGRQHYKTGKAFIDEIKAQGVSKRVHNVGVARNMMEPGAVVFLAHDDGEWEQCQKCREDVTCGDCDGKGRVKGEDGKYIDCPECMGRGEYETNTGGWVKIDGEEMMYREFLSRARRDDDFKATMKKLGINMKNRKSRHEVWDSSSGRCQHCNGSGRVPKGSIVGVFVPSGIEYVLRDDDTAKIKKEMEDAGAKIVTKSMLKVEARRGCGFRKPGGIYVIARGKGKPSKELAEVVKALTDVGTITPKGYEVVGDFVEFLKPVPLEGQKRFRGIKRWDLDPAAEDEAEMVLESIADESELEEEVA